MRVERKTNALGFDVAVSVEWPERVGTLEHGQMARLEHHVELGLKSLARRLSWHVVEWPRRRDVLRRMSLADADALGLKTEWRQAKQEGS